MSEGGINKCPPRHIQETAAVLRLLLLSRRMSDAFSRALLLLLLAVLPAHFVVCSVSQCRPVGALQ